MSDRMKKPSLVFTIICDDIRKEAGGKISLMGLFENIYATQFPVLHPRIAVISEWADGKGEFDIKTRILSPDRKSVLRETYSRAKFYESQMRHREVSVHLNLDFKIPGTYWIENYLDNEVVSSMPFNILQVKEQSFH